MDSKYSNKEKNDIIKLFEKLNYYKIKGEPHYDYLLRMPFYSLTKSKVIELNNQFTKKKQEYDILNKKTPSQLWIDDITILEKILG